MRSTRTISRARHARPVASGGTLRRHPAVVGILSVTLLLAGLLLATSPVSAAGTTFSVTSKQCLGPGSITQAVTDANAHPGADVISFTPGLVVDGGSCPDNTTQPGYAKWNYFMARVTESVTFEGNGARIQGQQFWLNPSGVKAMGQCPTTDYGTVMVASTPGFVLVGSAGGVDNAGIDVEVHDLNMDQLNSIASVRKNASLRITGSKMTNITRAVDCGGDGLISVHDGSLDLVDSEINSSFNWQKEDVLFAAGIIEVQGRANIVRSRLLLNAYAYAVSSIGDVRIVSSQLAASGGLNNMRGTIEFVNSTMYASGSPTTFERILSTGSDSVTNIVASTISVPYGKCSTAACRSRGYTAVPFTPVGGTINLRQSAIGEQSTVPADSKVIQTTDVLGRVTADTATWIQPVDGQDAAALRTVTGQPALLTSAPGLPTPGFLARYAPSVTPLLGTAGTPGVLLDVIADAGTGGANELKSPIDGSPITTDVFGHPRVDGSGRRTIGAVQQSLTPHLTVDSSGDGAASLSWNRPVDPPAPGLSGYGLLHRPVGTGTWSRVDISGPDTLTGQVTGLTNGTTYEFEVVGVSGGTDGPPSNIVTATPMGPITAPVATATPGDGSVLLSWTAGDCGGRSGTSYYEVVSRPAGGGSWELLLGHLSARIATIPGLTNGQTYDLAVVEVCGNGESSALGATTATPEGGVDPVPPVPPMPPIDPDVVIPAYTG